MSKEIQINDCDDLIAFVMREDVSAASAINVFENCFSGAEIVAITLVDSISKKADLHKDSVINKISNFIEIVKRGEEFKKTVIFFN